MPGVLPPIRVVLGPGGKLVSAVGPTGAPLPPHVIGQIMQALARNPRASGLIGYVQWPVGSFKR